MISTGTTIWDIAANAAPSLRLYRAGRLRIVSRSVDGRQSFDVVEPCAEPCIVKLVKGTCSRCSRPINLRLGSPRRFRSLELLPITGQTLIGLGCNGKPGPEFSARFKR